MTKSNFNLQFSVGDECYAVLAGLDRSRTAAQFELVEMESFVERFESLRQKVVNGSVTFDRNVLFEDLADDYIFDTLIWSLEEATEEEVINGDVLHPKAMVDEAVMALKRLRDGVKLVSMSKKATWEIKDCADSFLIPNSCKLEAAQAVFERAKAQLPPNACWHGVEGHGGLT